MTPATILSTLKTILEDSADLSYINDDNIFLGVRENVTIFPCIIIEPVGDRVIEENFNYEQRIININVTAYIQVYDKDKQIVGDTNTKGVLDVENNIRKALSSDTTLGLSDVYDMRLVTTVHNFEQFPIRGFGINVEIHYRQDRITRA